jgi:hypothetical protein
MKAGLPPQFGRRRIHSERLALPRFLTHMGECGGEDPDGVVEATA